MRRRNERGAGTLLTAGICLSLLAVGTIAAMAVLWLAQISAVQDSADLVSLAAAGAHAQGTDACLAAGEAAVRNHSELTECRVSGDQWSFVVEVRVGQPLQPPLPGASTIIERAATAGSGP